MAMMMMMMPSCNNNARLYSSYHWWLLYYNSLILYWLRRRCLRHSTVDSITKRACNTGNPRSRLKLLAAIITGNGKSLSFYHNRWWWRLILLSDGLCALERILRGRGCCQLLLLLSNSLLFNHPSSYRFFFNLSKLHFLHVQFLFLLS